MNKKNRKNKGFSLVELIIVIAIMAILAGIFAAQFMKHLKNSRISADLEAADRIAKKIEAQIALDEVTGESNVPDSGNCSTIADDILDGASEEDYTSKVKKATFEFAVDADGDVTITADGEEVYPNAGDSFTIKGSQDK